MIVHPATERDISDFLARPSHAVLLVGPSGSGKGSLTRHIAAGLLAKSPDELVNYPYITYAASLDGKAISIDAVRELQQAMTLKIPQTADRPVDRIIIIEDAHLLTTEAQNALLKTLEEPPARTVIIMAAGSAEALLPTILSRTRILHISPPAMAELHEHFIRQGHAPADVSRALLLSGGLPGLAQALLTDPASHPLYEATERARSLLRASVYERLAAADALSKQRTLCQDVLFILGQMAHAALQNADTMPPKNRTRWQAVLQQSYLGLERLKHNAQPKLVLLELMLNI